MLVRQGIVTVAGDRRGGRGGDRGVSVERVERLHAANGTGDHGDGVGRHQWHILWCPPQGQRVVGRAYGRPKGLQVAVDAAGREGRAVLQLHPLLLHLERHQLLLLTQRQVIVRGRPDHSHSDSHTHRGATLRGQSAVAPLHEFVALVAFVVKRRKREHIQEKKRGTDGYCHTQLGRIVPGFAGERQVGGSFRTFVLRIRRIGGDHRVACRGVGDSGWSVSCDAAVDFVEAMEMRHQFQPEGYLVCPVVVSNSRLQANMQILLIFRAELCPDDLLEAVGLGVDESGVLRNW